MTELVEGKEQHKRKKPFVLSRRVLLGGVGVLAARALLPEHFFAQRASAAASESLGADTDHLQETLSTETEVNLGSIKIFLDSNNNPVSYILNYGERQDFSDDEKLYLSDAKNRAISSGEIEPALQFREFGIIPPFQGVPERPLIEKAPEDILSPEELTQLHVEVINPRSKNSSKLFLRKGLFYGDGLLEAHRVLNENVPDTELPHELKLVVIDGEYITPEYMLNPEYEAVLPLLKAMQESVETYIKNHVVILEQKILSAKRMLPSLVGSEEHDQLQRKILEYKADILLYSRILKPSELIGEAFLQYQKVREAATAIGQYHYPNGEQPHTSHIFLAAPDAKDTVGQRIHTITYSPDGSLGLITYERQNQHGAQTPSVGQGFPNPEHLHKYEGEETIENDYLYAPTSGFVVNHELAHYLLMYVLPELGALGLMTKSNAALFIRNIPEIDQYIDQYKDGVVDATFPRITNEGLTDTVAYATMVKDFERWKASDYTDYSTIFPIVYEVPSTEHQPTGGYQLTDFSGQVIQPKLQST